MQVKLYLWDTAGQEKFQSESQSYVRNSKGCLAVYDVTKRATFDCLYDKITNYAKCLNDADDKVKNTNNNITGSHQIKRPDRKRLNVVLVGTKVDLLDNHEQNRQVTSIEAQNFAEKMNLAGFIELSTKLPEYKEEVNDCFRILVLNNFERSKKHYGFAAGIALQSDCNQSVDTSYFDDRELSQYLPLPSQFSKYGHEPSCYTHGDNKSYASAQIRLEQAAWEKKKKEESCC